MGDTSIGMNITFMSDLNLVNDSEACCAVVKKTSRIKSDIGGFERAYDAEIYALIASLGFLTAFAIFANGLLLYVLFKNSNLRNMKNLHFFILVLTSIINAAIYYFYILLTYHSDFDLLDTVCHYFYGWAIEAVYNISLTTMLGMCMERLISVVEPLWFSTVWVDDKYSLWLSLAMVALGTVPSILPLMTKFVEYHHSRGWMYCRLAGEKDHLMTYIWVNNCLIYFPAIFGVVAVYIAVQVKAMQARRLTKQFREECKLEQVKKLEAETGINLGKIKSALYNSRITIILLCIFVGTKLPIAILQYAHYFHMKLPFSVRNCEFVGNVCRFFFSVLTPFLFPLLNTPLKNKLLDIVCLRTRKKTGKSQKSTSLSSVSNTLKSKSANTVDMKSIDV